MQEELIEKLIEAAKLVRQRAYAPYSNFNVGAAVLCDGGRMFSGANVENASFGLTICAERSAVFSAVSAGCRKIKAIAIAANGKAFPCGACRQVIAEFADESAAIVIVNTEDDTIIKTTVGELLPNVFKFSR